MLSEWSEEDDPGIKHAIIIIRLFELFDINESLKDNVNFEALKGTYGAFNKKYI